MSDKTNGFISLGDIAKVFSEVGLLLFPDNCITFCRPSEIPHGCFSNFYIAPIRINDLIYPTIEHWYQASKFDDAEWRERIRTCEKPKEAKNLAYSGIEPIRSDWETIKYAIMKQGLMAKFTQHASLCETLLSTGNKALIELSKRDQIWGARIVKDENGNDKLEGQNLLGISLMEVREEIRHSRGEPFSFVR